MKKKISDLTEQEINYLVGKAEGLNIEINDSGFCVINTPYDDVIGLNNSIRYDPCSMPEQAWPIIEREKINIIATWGNNHGDKSWMGYKSLNKSWDGRTSLIAAMRCRVAMAFGDSVEVPFEKTI